jgi:hypothetical protein
VLLEVGIGKVSYFISFFFSEKRFKSKQKRKEKSYACTNHLKYAQKIFNISILHFDCFAGQVFSQNLRNRLDLASSEAGPDSEDNSYLGYSLALGDFTGNGGSDLAVGMPRAANLTGKVRNHFFCTFLIDTICCIERTVNLFDQTHLTYYVSGKLVE